MSIETLVSDALSNLPPGAAITLSYTSEYGWTAWVRGRETSAIRYYQPTAEQAVWFAVSEVLDHVSAAPE